MGNITLSIPEEVHKQMKRFSEVRWSEVARQAIVSRIETLMLAEKLAKKSKLTEKDVREFSEKLNRAATKRFLNDSARL